MRFSLFIAIALLAIGQAGPLAAQSRENADPQGRRWQHRYADDHTGRTNVDRRKPRICYRPDVGRYSRLIPYSC